MTRKVLRNISDPLVGVRRDVHRLLIDRQRLEAELRRQGDSGGRIGQRLAELDGELCRLRRIAIETMRRRRSMHA